VHFVEKRYSSDPTTGRFPNRAVEAMLRSAGCLITAQPEDEVYVCARPDARR
jgi:tRNA (mo5U34)-methyltransferase